MKGKNKWKWRWRWLNYIRHKHRLSLPFLVAKKEKIFKLQQKCYIRIISRITAKLSLNFVCLSKLRLSTGSQSEADADIFCCRSWRVSVREMRIRNKGQGIKIDNFESCCIGQSNTIHQHVVLRHTQTHETFIIGESHGFRPNERSPAECCCLIPSTLASLAHFLESFCPKPKSRSLRATS